MPHLQRAHGVGDNALIGLLNIRTHLEPTSQSQHQYHQPYRCWLFCCCLTAVSEPQTTPGLGGAKGSGYPLLL